jgi:hypothetical protein
MSVRAIFRTEMLFQPVENLITGLLCDQGQNLVAAITIFCGQFGLTAFLCSKCRHADAILSAGSSVAPLTGAHVPSFWPHLV